MPEQNPDEFAHGPVLAITDLLAIPREEVRFRTSRSGGPGGQHVNKVETKVELLFDIAGSPSLTDDQRYRLLVSCASFVDSEGVLHIVGDRFRSQMRNREDVLERFVATLQHAYRPRRVRKPTRVTRAAKERRLADKRAHSERKRNRGKKRDE
jgi:ribosome-associated protein